MKKTKLQIYTYAYQFLNDMIKQFKIKHIQYKMCVNLRMVGHKNRGI